MLTILSKEQREKILQHGTPLPLIDDTSDTTYMLLAVELLPDREQRGFTARIPEITAYGEGDTKEAACLALSEALRGCLDAFGDA